MAFADTILSDLTTVLADFGTVVTRYKRDGSTVTLTGIFDEAVQVISPETMSVETTEPQLVCKTSDVSDLDKSAETLTINGVDYRVIGVEPDGTGLTRLRLSLHRSR